MQLGVYQDYIQTVTGLKQKIYITDQHTGVHVAVMAGLADDPGQRELAELFASSVELKADKERLELAFNEAKKVIFKLLQACPETPDKGDIHIHHNPACVEAITFMMGHAENEVVDADRL